MSLLPLLPLLAAAAASPQAAGPALTDCAALRGSVGAVAVDAATAVVPAPAWRPPETGRPGQPVAVPFCRVEGRIEGNIGFELWLPANWNGRLLGAGVGGDAGVYNYHDMAIRLAQGFATVTTDSGHKVTQARWMREAKPRADYEHRAVHLTAQAAKALIARYYGKQPERAYYLGCSGGGRQALKEMQNYPGDYDGVVAGAPGPYMPLQSVRMMWFGLEQQRHPLGALADADWSLYESRVFAACDGLDGVKDGVVENPAACRFRTATLLCKPGQAQGCLTAPRLAMLDTIIAPMRDEAGRAMDGGLFPGVRTRPGPPSPLLRVIWADAVYDDPNWDALTFRRTADLAAANRVMPELRADRTDIAGFLARGNKAIIYQGWQDPSTNAGPTIKYYAALAAAYGGAEKLDDSVRLFMAPGMYHCRGGPGADLFGGSAHFPVWSEPDRDVLWSLIRWVEQGAAPSQLVATRREGEAERFTRKLCPFPQAARYDGQGPTDSAASYSCQADPLLRRMLARQ
jgi:feruloyl esterase